MSCWEPFYTQIFPQQNTLIYEQKVNDLNPPYSLTYATRRHVTQSDTHHSSVLTTAANKHHQHKVRPS